MRAIFLSDAHLKGPDDPASARLCLFLDRLQACAPGEAARPETNAPQAVDLVVIAGDFFDFWFERGGRVFPGFLPVIERLRTLRERGVRICLCEGNHDFFLADFFTARLGIEVFPEWAELRIDGLRVLVSHGDTVDRDNRRYLALRAFLRSRAARLLMRLLPLRLLWALGRYSSAASKKLSVHTDDRLAEVLYRFALEKYHEGVDAVIVGHCHRPLLREQQQEGKTKTFAALGDWGVSDTFLVCDDGRFALHRFSPESNTETA